MSQPERPFVLVGLAALRLGHDPTAETIDNLEKALAGLPETLDHDWHVVRHAGEALVADWRGGCPWIVSLAALKTALRDTCTGPFIASEKHPWQDRADLCG